MECPLCDKMSKNMETRIQGFEKLIKQLETGSCSKTNLAYQKGFLEALKIIKQDYADCTDEIEEQLKSI